MIRTQTRLQYANGYLELGMIDDAAAELDAIVDDDRSLSEVLMMRVRLYLESRNWELMQAVSRRLAETEPEEPFGWINWAYALRERNRLEDAKNVAVRGLELHPDEAILQFNLACYHSLLGELAEARTCLDHAIALDSAFEREYHSDPDLANLRNFESS